MELNKNYRCRHKESGDIFETYEVDTQECTSGLKVIITTFSVRGVTTKGEFRIYSGECSDFHFERRVNNA